MSQHSGATNTAPIAKRRAIIVMYYLVLFLHLLYVEYSKIVPLQYSLTLYIYLNLLNRTKKLMLLRSFLCTVDNTIHHKNCHI
jgi:hypothetical protein